MIFITAFRDGCFNVLGGFHKVRAVADCLCRQNSYIYTMAIEKCNEQLSGSQSLLQNAKRRRERAKKSKSWSISNIIGATFGLVALLYLPYIIIGSEIMNFLIKRQGICIQGVITTHTIHVRYSKPYYQYKIIVNGTEYLGSSLYTDEDKVGDSICVLYFKSFPSNNKPINFFDPDERINCNCK